MVGKEITIHWEKVYPKFSAKVIEESDKTVKVMYGQIKLEFDKSLIVKK